MAVSAFSSIEEALQLANDSPYGLAGYVMTNDLSTATRVYEGLEFGIVGVNDMVPATAEAPFGGVKTSGFGREAGLEGLQEYMEPKFVSIALGLAGLRPYIQLRRDRSRRHPGAGCRVGRSAGSRRDRRRRWRGLPCGSG